MNAAHSPTPWKVEPCHVRDGVSDDAVLDAGGRTVALIGDFLSDVHDPIGPSKRAANVQLIAASPRLRAALEQLCDAFAGDPDCCLECNRGEGATGLDENGAPCGLCTPQRAALIEAELAIAEADGRSESSEAA